MLDILYMEAFAGFSVMEVVGFVVLVLVVGAIIKRILGRKANTDHMISLSCKCGWSGQVSKYTRRCPSCNGTI